MERDGGSLSSALKDENTKFTNSTQKSNSSIPVSTKHEAYQKPVVYKIIILGESGVGKLLLFRYMTGVNIY